MDVDVAQRWSERRPRWVASRQVIDPDRYHVEKIGDADARRFLEREHYSGTMGASRLTVGLFRREAGGVRRLSGVAVFGFLMQPAAANRWCDQECEDVPELNRLACLPEVEFNGESFFVAKALTLLREKMPRARALISYSDPVPRVSTCGRMVLIGHVGQVYQALGMRFVGRSSARTLLLDQNGKVISGRSLSKLRNAERGQEYVARQLECAGAPARRFGEEGPDYLERALREGPFRRLRHPGNLVYVSALDQSRQTISGLAPGLPYLKRRDLGL